MFVLRHWMCKRTKIIVWYIYIHNHCLGTTISWLIFVQNFEWTPVKQKYFWDRQSFLRVHKFIDPSGIRNACTLYMYVQWRSYIFYNHMNMAILWKGKNKNIWKFWYAFLHFSLLWIMQIQTCLTILLHFPYLNSV